jgi:hypothetical protein
MQANFIGGLLTKVHFIISQTPQLRARFVERSDFQPATWPEVGIKRAGGVMAERGADDVSGNRAFDLQNAMIEEYRPKLNVAEKPKSFWETIIGS